MPIAAQAQEEEPKFPLENFYVKRKKSPRAIFKNFRFGLSTGYGATYLSHQLKDSFAIYQAKGKPAQMVNLGPTTPQRFGNWVNDAVKDNTPGYPPANFLVRGDTTRIVFKGAGWNIPIRATIHYEFKQFRIGLGYSYEYMHLGTFRPISYGDKIATFTPSAPSGFMSKYFGSLGASFYRWDNYLFIADVNIGGFNPGGNFNKALIDHGIYFNLGVTAERELSEYLRAFIRPSFDFKSYNLKIPGSTHTISHSMNALYVNIGVTYTIPELPKCYNKDCKIQINHAHGNKEYRSRVHPIYKKQNPGYGENSPMIKYKGKNKKKINPY